MIIMLLMFSILTGDSASIHSFHVKDISGHTFDFSTLKGKKILIVNTASECGNTPQYADLEKLYELYKDQLVVVGFPANNFGQQEPGENKEIAAFCKSNYGVTFPMMAKVSVLGNDMDPLFHWLINQPNPDFTGDIKWNFEKFLLDENGKLIHRFKSKMNPLNQVIIDAILTK